MKGYLKIVLLFLFIFLLTVISMGVYDYNHYQSANRQVREYRGIIATQTTKRTEIIDSMFADLGDSMEEDMQDLQEINKQLKETSNLVDIISQNADLRRQMNDVQQNMPKDVQEEFDVIFHDFALTEKTLVYAVTQYNDAVFELNKTQKHVPLCFLKESLKLEPQSYLFYGER